MTNDLLAMSPSGRFLAVRATDGLAVVDLLGTSPRRTFPCASGRFAFAGTTLAILDDELRLEPLEGARPPRRVAVAGATLHGFHGRAADAVLVDDALVAGDRVERLEHRAGTRWFPLYGRAIAAVDPTRIAIVTGRATASQRVQADEIRIPKGAIVREVAPLFAGRLLAVVLAGDGDDAVYVVRPTGQLVHRITVPASTCRAIAVERGLLVLGTGDREVVLVDLRYGRILGRGVAPDPIDALVIDDDGRTLGFARATNEAPIVTTMRADALLQSTVAVDTTDEAPRLEVHVPFVAPPLQAPVAARSIAIADAGAVAAGTLSCRTLDVPARTHEVGPFDAAQTAPTGTSCASVTPPCALDACDVAQTVPTRVFEVDPALARDSNASAEASFELHSFQRADGSPSIPPVFTTRTVAPVEIPACLPLALGTPRPVAVIIAGESSAMFADGNEHVHALIDLVAARAAVAIASAWHTGRLGGDAPGDHPFEREVAALVGSESRLAGPQLDDALRVLATRAADVANRARASIAHGRSLPFIELAAELALSPLATQLLVAIVAPELRSEVGRLYAILGNDSRRTTCDRALLATLLDDNEGRVADELAPHAPLVRFGVVRRALDGGLAVDPVVIERLRGCQPADTLRTADRSIDELVVDRSVVAGLVRELAAPRPAAAPLRLVIRGKLGSGRHAVIAALAARLGRSIACIDAGQLAARERAALLRDELARARLRSAIPVVSGLDAAGELDGELREAAERVRAVIRTYPGPLVIRARPGADMPLDPGFVDVTLPPLSERERAAVFAAALPTIDTAALAARYRIGPGTIARVAAEATRRIAASDADPAAIVDEVVRQHVAARLGKSAHRVTRLATWDQLALPDDMRDSLRELIGRARHSRTVYEDWGYDARIGTARGLTALFYGPPGTGKTMVAGLVARELGLELYRVDLANVMSKWVGETEKNLGEIFDAAEDGRVVLLFDEADSLFAKRTTGTTSNDRYANLEVNYLLQRLDAFEGVAILTTNLEGSIDPAFKRRLSMRMYFPFPDEDIRAELWAAHVTPQVPVAGPLDFAALARRFPLSGGYIRNSALRAAFLAAQEQSALTQAHLERAVLLEYRELGKLANDGRMD